MTQRAPTDMLVAINGPEDGASFPLVRTPIYIGCDPTCQAHVRLDSFILPCHVMVTAVHDGYRVRAVQGPNVYVDGKPVGYIRSRTLRPGGELQIGHTLFTVQLAPDGLAKRSHGLRRDSDMVWAVRQGARAFVDRLARTGSFLFNWESGLLTNWKAWIILGVVGTYSLWPGLRSTINSLVQRGYADFLAPVWEQISSMLGLG